MRNLRLKKTVLRKAGVKEEKVYQNLSSGTRYSGNKL